LSTQLRRLASAFVLVGAALLIGELGCRTFVLVGVALLIGEKLRCRTSAFVAVGAALLIGEALGCLTSAFVLVGVAPVMGGELGSRTWLRNGRTPSLCPRAGVGPVANAVASAAPRAPVIVRTAAVGNIFLSLTCAWPWVEQAADGRAAFG